MSSQEYISIKEALPPLGQEVEIKVSSQPVELDPLTYFTFKMDIFEATLTSPEKALFLWKIKKLEEYKFPLKAVEYWKELNYDPIESRFEILDL